MILAGIVALKTWPIKTLNKKKDILNSELIILAMKKCTLFECEGI